MNDATKDKTALLSQLRIEREAEPAPGGHGRRPLWIGAGVVLIVLIAAAWWWYAHSRGLPVHAAVAQPVRVASSGGGAPQGASLLDASGYVVARREATVSAQIIGQVQSVAIEEGQQVKKGEVMARLDDSVYQAALVQAQAEVAQAQAALQASRTALADARPIYVRNQKQLAARVISQQDFDAAKATFDTAKSDVAIKTQALAVARAGLKLARRNEDNTIVRAPFAGVVTAKNAQPGQIVSPQFVGGGGVADIVDMNSLEVDVDVSENYINRVHPGMPTRIKLDAYPDWEIPGHVIAIIPTADRSKATVKVRVGFETKDSRILPQMGARVSFLSAAPASATGAAGPSAAGAGGQSATGAGAPRSVIVPADAVQANGAGGVVYVIQDGRVERRTVSLGGRGADGQTVLSGLSAGSQVVVGNLDQLHDGMRVRVEQ